MSSVKGPGAGLLPPARANTHSGLPLMSDSLSHLSPVVLTAGLFGGESQTPRAETEPHNIGAPSPSCYSRSSRLAIRILQTLMTPGATESPGQQWCKGRDSAPRATSAHLLPQQICEFTPDVRASFPRWPPASPRGLTCFSSNSCSASRA